MFESLKDFINSRLGPDIIIFDLFNSNSYFIHVDIKNLYAVLFFLKNDPDLKLSLFDQLFALPHETSFMDEPIHDTSAPYEMKIYYQLKSLNLPYRVTVVLSVNEGNITIPSIAAIFSGARWQEQDLENKYNITISESARYL